MKRTAQTFVLLLGVACLAATAFASEEASGLAEIDTRSLSQLSEEELQAEADIRALLEEMESQVSECSPHDAHHRTLAKCHPHQLRQLTSEEEEEAGMIPRSLVEEEDEDLVDESEQSLEEASEEENAVKPLSPTSKECKKCCKECNCHGCRHGSEKPTPAKAYASADGRKTILFFEESFEEYKKKVEKCQPPMPPKKCHMKLVVHHASNQVEMCKECIVNPHDILYHKCYDKIVFPVPPIKPDVKPPHPEHWHQVCTCTWMKNGPNYHGPTRVWHHDKNLKEKLADRKKYLEELKEYRSKIHSYHGKLAKYNKEKKHFEWEKRHDEATARHFNRLHHEINESEAKKLGFHHKPPAAPLRVLCPCNARGATRELMHAENFNAARQLAADTFGSEEEQMNQMLGTFMAAFSAGAFGSPPPE